MDDRVGDFLKAGCGPSPCSWQWCCVTLSPEPGQGHQGSGAAQLWAPHHNTALLSHRGHWIANTRINNRLDADVTWLKPAPHSKMYYTIYVNFASGEIKHCFLRQRKHLLVPGVAIWSLQWLVWLQTPDSVSFSVTGHIDVITSQGSCLGLGPGSDSAVVEINKPQHPLAVLPVRAMTAALYQESKKQFWRNFRENWALILRRRDWR